MSKLEISAPIRTSPLQSIPNRDQAASGRVEGSKSFFGKVAAWLKGGEPKMSVKDFKAELTAKYGSFQDRLTEKQQARLESGKALSPERQAKITAHLEKNVPMQVLIARGKCAELPDAATIATSQTARELFLSNDTGRAFMQQMIDMNSQLPPSEVADIVFKAVLKPSVVEAAQTFIMQKAHAFVEDPEAGDIAFLEPSRVLEKTMMDAIAAPVSLFNAIDGMDNVPDEIKTDLKSYLFLEHQSPQSLTSQKNTESLMDALSKAKPDEFLMGVSPTSGEMHVATGKETRDLMALSDDVRRYNRDGTQYRSERSEAASAHIVYVTSAIGRSGAARLGTEMLQLVDYLKSRSSLSNDQKQALDGMLRVGLSSVSRGWIEQYTTDASQVLKTDGRFTGILPPTASDVEKMIQTVDKQISIDRQGLIEKFVVPILAGDINPDYLANG